MKIIDSQIALIGDLHIGVNKNSETFFDITEEWMKYFIEELEDRGITTVFILGDLFHYRDEISLLALDKAVEILKLFPKTIKIHMITGNHDCYFRDNSEVHSLGSFDEWDNIYVYDTISEIELRGGKKITMVPWGGDISEIKKSEFIFGHFEIKNFKLNSYTICKKGLTSSDLLRKCNHVYSGHFHKYQTKKYKAGHITYLGSPYQQNFGDVGNENGFHIIDVDTEKSEFVQNPDNFPIFHYIRLSKLKETYKKEYIKGNFVKIQIDKDIKEKPLDQLMAKVNAEAPKDLFIDDKTVKKVFDNVEFSDKIKEIDLFSTTVEYIKMLKSEIEEPIINKAKEYYEKCK